MNVLLVSPFQDIEPYIMPNLGLGYLCSALKNAGHYVEYLDCCKVNMSIKGWAAKIETNTYDVIGIQLISYNYQNVRKMLQTVKQCSPEPITIVGGAHAKAVPERLLKNTPEIDYVIYGEGEIALVQLLAELENSNTPRLHGISNLVWRDDNQVVKNKKEYIEKLDDLAFPAWEYMDPRTYSKIPHGLLCKQLPIAPISTSRGCCYNCAFCSACFDGNKIRRRSPANVLAEIELLVNNYGVKEFHFEDDNFTFNKTFASEVCQGIIDRKLQIVWACPNGVRLDTLDIELLQLMEKSGCYSFALGIESGSEKVLKLMKKSVTVQTYHEKIRLIKNNTNIKITGFFIFGFPGETEADLEITKQFIMQEPLDRISVGPFIPFPGTPIFNKLLTENKIAHDYDWSLLSVYNNDIYVSSKRSKQELFREIRIIHIRFFLRFKIILSILAEFKSLKQVIVAMRMLWFWLGLGKMKS